MTAPGSASGLPQEAVDALGARHVPYRYRRDELTYCDKDGQRWPCEVARILDALAAERAKVAALQQAVDKVRALHHRVQRAFTAGMTSNGVDINARGTTHLTTFIDSCSCGNDACPTVALLPDVQADDRGKPTPTPATPCADCGTTRTICDAGLNTYDTRCCEQCGHGVT